MTLSFQISREVITRIAIQTGIVPSRTQVNEIDFESLSEQERRIIADAFWIPDFTPKNRNEMEEFFTVREFLDYQISKIKKEEINKSEAKKEELRKIEENRAKFLGNKEAVRQVLSSYDIFRISAESMRLTIDEETESFFNTTIEEMRTEKEKENEQKRAEKEAKKLLKDEADAKAEALTRVWVTENGSEFLKDRMNLGYEFFALAEEEMACKILNVSSVKCWDCFKYDKEITKPSANKIDTIKKLKEKGVTNHPISIYRVDNSDYYDDESSDYYANVVVNLPNGNTGDYVVWIA